MLYITETIFYLIPVAAVLFFIISIIRFFYAKNKNKQAPDTYSESQMKNRKTLLTISSAIAGILVIVAVGFALLLFLAASFM